MFQKCSLKQAILQLSKAIAVIKYYRESCHTIQCSVTFQNSINCLIKSQWQVLLQKVWNNPSLVIKAVFIFDAYKLLNLTVLKHNINREAFLYIKPKR